MNPAVPMHKPRHSVHGFHFCPKKWPYLKSGSQRIWCIFDCRKAFPTPPVSSKKTMLIVCSQQLPTVCYKTARHIKRFVMQFVFAVIPWTSEVQMQNLMMISSWFTARWRTTLEF